MCNESAAPASPRRNICLTRVLQALAPVATSHAAVRVLPSSMQVHAYTLTSYLLHASNQCTLPASVLHVHARCSELKCADCCLQANQKAAAAVAAAEERTAEATKELKKVRQGCSCAAK